jgi:Putative transposase DNA-binding domain
MSPFTHVASVNERLAIDTFISGLGPSCKDLQQVRTCDRRNRPTQSVFRCQSCGYEVNADLNGVRNVAWKYLVGLGNSEASWQSVNLPIVGEGALHLSPASPRL